MAKYQLNLSVFPLGFMCVTIAVLIYLNVGYVHRLCLPSTVLWLIKSLNAEYLWGVPHIGKNL